MVRNIKWQGIDTTFIGIEKANSRTRAETLCPYSTIKIKEALSHKGTNKRIKVVDSAILKCMKVNKSV